jgi:multiple sugar transport system substrate-binding protein
MHNCTPSIQILENGESASLSVYWILRVAAGSPRAEIAYRFLRHWAAAPMDNLLTLEGGIGWRKSTWSDGDVNATISFYYPMELLHRVARELPCLSHWTVLAAVIDKSVLAAINTDQPTAELVWPRQTKV